MESFDATAARSAEIARDVRHHPEQYRVLTGERPTGPLHLGHYFGTIVERIRLQRAGVETFLVLADYQVITDRDSVGNIKDNVHSAVLDYLAAGLDPERTTIFTHSSVPALNQLMLPFLSLVTEAELHRNPTVKSELAASGHALSGLLLTYPVHQAADILFCKGNLVPVGKDNLPHVEMARVIARRFNDRYGSVFPIPEALITSAPEVPGLDGRKCPKATGTPSPYPCLRTRPPRSFDEARPIRIATSPSTPTAVQEYRRSSAPPRSARAEVRRKSPTTSAAKEAANSNGWSLTRSTRSCSNTGPGEKNSPTTPRSQPEYSRKAMRGPTRSPTSPSTRCTTRWGPSVSQCQVAEASRHDELKRPTLRTPSAASPTIFTSDTQTGPDFRQRSTHLHRMEYVLVVQIRVTIWNIKRP
jgi:hypothetical protein